MFKVGDLVIVTDGHYGVTAVGSVGIVSLSTNSYTRCDKWLVLTGPSVEKGDYTWDWELMSTHYSKLDNNRLVTILYGVENA